jgi:Ca-activated chloride channel family protein
MAEFHFLRPWWLLALPVGLLLLWRLFGGGGRRGSWYAVVDRVLQPYVLSRPKIAAGRRWPLLAAALGWAAATVALAGPAWQRIPVPAFRSDEALVVALDLSRSMDATDIDPSRLARAKLKLLDLLDRRKSGQTALVVFSANAFTVTPLTTDTHTIAALVGALSTGIMPSHGSHPEAGLKKAGELLRQGGMRRGEILLISDADVARQSIDEVRELARRGYRVDVLAVGTAQGAPIRESDGGFLTDSTGHVVVPGVDLGGLHGLADAGGGRFARLTADDSDLDALFPKPAKAGAVVTGNKNDHRADVWRDEGVWLAVLVLPLLASAFRRGWLCAWLLLAVLPLPRAAQAFEWNSLWQRPDQRAARQMQAGHPARAAKLFEDPQWRAAAQYLSGDYAAAAAALRGIDTADAAYNRGNALAKAGRLEAAIKAYDRALELDPNDADARYNRDLVEKLLAKNKAKKSKKSQQQQKAQTKQGGGASGDGRRQADKGGSGGKQQRRKNGDRQAKAKGAADTDEGQDSGAQQDGDEQADTRRADAKQNRAGRQNKPADGADRQASAGPKDLEKWASQQAAEQWLRRIPQDPGGLLRRKFLYQYQRLGVDQDGGSVWPDDEKHPW